MQKNNPTVHLLILDSSENDAEALVSLLRNAGKATRAHRITSEEDLEDTLQAGNWDLFLARDSNQALSADDALAMIGRMNKDIPFVLLTEGANRERSVAIMEAGARAAVPFEFNDLLVLTINRELAALDERRRRRALESRLRETEQRCQLLLESSKDAIAYISDGIHIYANRSYLELLGHSDIDDLVCVPVLDTLTRESQEQYRAAMKSFAENGEDGMTMSCTNRRSDDHELKATLSISAATYDGEACTQIILQPEPHQRDPGPEFEAKLEPEPEAEPEPKPEPRKRKDHTRSSDATTDEAAAVDRQDNHSAVQAIQEALEGHRFRLLFQPVICLQGGGEAHYEASVRMLDQDGQEVLPDTFLPPVGPGDTAIKIDRWVILNAIKQLTSHRSKGHDIHLFLNVTAQTLLDQTFAPWLDAALKAAQLPGKSLIFQIRASDANLHVKQAGAFIKGVRERHCKVSIAQFGSADTQSNILTQVDTDYVKIDGSLTREVQTNDEARKQLGEMVKKLQADGKLAIIPRVENAGVLATLWQAGVDYIQGYYLQAPVPEMNYDFGDG